MIRPVIAILFLTGAVGFAPAEDRDPVKDKLLAAKVAYDKETEQIHKQTTDWLDKREEAARKDGDKKLLDRVKADRKAFDEDGELPKTVPEAIKQKHDRAYKALDAAFAEAVKAYTKANKSAEAASVEEARRAFARPQAIDLLTCTGGPQGPHRLGGMEEGREEPRVGRRQQAPAPPVTL
jgi:hypothetical protein